MLKYISYKCYVRMYDRCDVRIIVNGSLLIIEQNTVRIPKVGHDQVKVSNQLVHYMCESETEL